MDPTWKHPFTCIIAGPTSCGKSTFIKRFIEEQKYLVNTSFEEIIYCKPRDYSADCSIGCTKIFDGVPDIELFNDRKSRLVILDDMMREADENIVDLFTKGSHHYNLSVIFVTQNIFNQGKGRRDISLNSHYIVLFKNPRDKQQILHLSKQVCPENVNFMREAYADATAEPHGYILLDLTQSTPDLIRFRTAIFQSDNPSNVVYIPKST